MERKINFIFYIYMYYKTYWALQVRMRPWNNFVRNRICCCQKTTPATTSICWNANKSKGNLLRMLRRVFAFRR